MASKPTDSARSDGDVIVASPSVVGALLTSLSIVVSVIAILIPLGWLGRTWSAPLVSWVIRLLAIFMTAGATVFLGLIAVVSIRALFLPRPVVRMDAEGILDRRFANRVIPWSNIKRVTTFTEPNLLVALRTPARPGVDSVRVNFFGMALSQLPLGRASFALAWSPKPSLPRAMIRTLVERHGAEWVHDKSEQPRRRRWSIS